MSSSSDQPWRSNSRLTLLQTNQHATGYFSTLTSRPDFASAGSHQVASFSSRSSANERGTGSKVRDSNSSTFSRRPPWVRYDSWRSSCDPPPRSYETSTKHRYPPDASNAYSSSPSKNDYSFESRASRETSILTEASTRTTPSSTGKTKPKNFEKPLTCFYWHTQGWCNKSDEDCYYAHYATGIVAAAPVRLGNGEAVAGKYAERVMDDAANRENNLRDWKDMLDSRERELEVMRREFQLKERTQAQAKAEIASLWTDIQRAIGSLNEATIEAIHNIERRKRDAIKLAKENSSEGGGGLRFNQIMSATIETEDRLLDAAAIFKVKTDAISYRMKKQGNIFDEALLDFHELSTPGEAKDDGGVQL